MKIVVFSGTSEGKEIAEYLNGKGIDTLVSVATEYGRIVMEEMPFVSVHTGRLDRKEMLELVKSCDFVIDATHPYARKVTLNIKYACEALGIEYIRLLRDDIICSNAIIAENTASAVEFLKQTEGRIFVSTGSKELDLYSEIPSYKTRIAARVLPVSEAVEKCGRLGLENVIYGKGPFTYEENLKAFKKFNAKWLVTKSSGRNGGFDEKISAARDLGMNIIVIKRPQEDNGLSIEEVKRLIDEKLEKNNKKFPLFISIAGKKVLVVGGGNIAVRRINTLLEFGAKIKVVADKIKKERISGRVEYVERFFEPADVDDVFMVIAATDDREVNHSIYKICSEKNILVSTADCRDECTFYFPAVCLNDKLSIGVVSDGSGHTLVSNTAREIRRLINNE